LPQIVPFVILGTLEKKSGKGSILDVFGAKSEENGKISKIKLKTVPDGVTL
jgi:predicted RNA-binding protein